MTAAPVIIILCLIGLIVASVAVPGSIIWALPLAVVLIAVAAFGRFRSSRESAHKMRELRDQADSDTTDFTERDHRTLTS
jgi:Flp pilus assembly protein TadB